MRSGSATGERTQYRQLIDLLGTLRPGEDGTGLVEIAYARLEDLGRRIPPEEQSKILREPGQRLRNRQLVAALAKSEPKAAAAAMATARLTAAEWADLIPRLPVMARGFLRHRRDLPQAALDVLAQLGVHDLALPGRSGEQKPSADAGPPPDRSEPKPKPNSNSKSKPEPEPEPEPGNKMHSPALGPASPAPAAAPRKPTTHPTAAQPRTEPIGALLDRIARFSEARRNPLGSPRLPLGDAAERAAPVGQATFVTDAGGTITQASAETAPWLTGMQLLHPRGGALVRFEADVAHRLRVHQPLRAARIVIDAAPLISGEWQLDAIPTFAEDGGAFAGYRGMLRRPAAAEMVASDPARERAEQMRQMMHELRTPVGAIQGFGEIIQQEMLGPVPHEYRAHAAAISVDAAKLLAGFDEVDRLVKLETQALALESGETDFRAAVAETLRRLAGVLDQRNAGFDFTASGASFMTSLSRGEALGLSWRILATASGALAAGERVALELTGDGASIALRLELPQRLQKMGPDNPGTLPRRPVVSAGAFGPRFALRLAAAEAAAAGGSLHYEGGVLTLSLPCSGASGTQTKRDAQHATG